MLQKSINAYLHFRHIAEQELEEILAIKKNCTEKLNEMKTELNTFKASRKTQEDEMEKISRYLIFLFPCLV